ncbi:MAG: hypothetical protein HC893_01800 [Chloroflexaceae bacterium]|nr:hypothetical protein [Chloroflexaceae bacterium]NJL32806.1 hypothetical protein [Chloroflexaceae bacterium]NJO05171.1 hypothetical protein [Chloroflexaceae bacterium]
MANTRVVRDTHGDDEFLRRKIVYEKRPTGDLDEEQPVVPQERIVPRYEEDPALDQRKETVAVPEQPAHIIMDEEDLMIAPPPVISLTDRRRIQVRRVQKGIYFVVNVIAIFLGIRLLLQLLGANPENPFVIFIFGLTWPFAAPFKTLFSAMPTMGETSFEFGVLFGIFMYYIFAWIGAHIVRFAMMRSIETTERLDR